MLEVFSEIVGFLRLQSMESISQYIHMYIIFYDKVLCLNENIYLIEESLS